MTVGVMGIIALLILLFLGVHVSVTMLLVGAAGFGMLAGAPAAIGLIKSVFYSTVTTYTITVIPLFILMGQFIYYAGVSGNLYKSAYTWLGRMPGGLAVSTIAACGAFAALCGSSAATAATFGTVSLPEMTKKYNYDRGYACASIVAGGTLGILIPPSNTFIWYGLITEQSIAKLFAAGFGAGILLMICYMAVAVVQARLKPSWAPATVNKTTWKEKFASLPGSLPAFLLFLVVIGGIFLGVFSPNEGAAIGAFGGFLCLVFTRKLSVKIVMDCLRTTVESVGMIVFILACTKVFGSFLAITRIPINMAGFVSDMNANRYVILFVFVVIYLFLGMIMDALPMVLLTIPIFFPIMRSLGFDPIWYGVITVMCAEMGQITPPVGLNLFVIKGIAPDVPMADIITRALPYVIAIFIAMIVITIFPNIALFLPRFLYG
ncbi:MAG: TRAP transporter large permease [Oscillospiraceae bacterium]|nr:TRAP transporter large permease [Oscillospiraceae bacterium]